MYFNNITMSSLLAAYVSGWVFFDRPGNWWGLLPSLIIIALWRPLVKSGREIDRAYDAVDGKPGFKRTWRRMTTRTIYTAEGLAKRISSEHLLDDQKKVRVAPGLTRELLKRTAQGEKKLYPMWAYHMDLRRVVRALLDLEILPAEEVLVVILYGFGAEDATPEGTRKLKVLESFTEEFFSQAYFRAEFLKEAAWVFDSLRKLQALAQAAPEEMLRTLGALGEVHQAEAFMSTPQGLELLHSPSEIQETFRTLLGDATQGAPLVHDSPVCRNTFETAKALSMETDLVMAP